MKGLVAAIAGVMVVAAVACGGGESNRAGSPTTPTSSAARAVDDHVEIDLGFESHGTVLAGTLFLPEAGGPHPGLVWVHASGKHERLKYGAIVAAANEAGLAFFSYDKRGVGESAGTCCPADAEDAGLAEFGEQADDALAALEAIRARPEVDGGHVGFLGVSQAGWIVPIAATRSPHVAFTVLVSGSTVTTGEEQLYSKLTGDANTSVSTAEVSRQLAAHGPSGFDPKPFLANMSIPGLWLFGSADGSIPPTESEAVLDELKAQGKDFSYKVFPGAGHGLLDVEPPPPPEVIPTIIGWLTQHVA